MKGGATDQESGVSWEKLLEILKARGLEPYADSRGKVRLRGPRLASTEPLLGVLRLFEKEVRHLVDLKARRRIRREDTGELVAQWAVGEGATDLERLASLQGEHAETGLVLEHYAAAGSEAAGGQWQWRQFASAGGLATRSSPGVES